ncbi:hypothetical protein C4556_01545 [Candidatus Parcubacteria bacterium]|nr:MAG: hypothetical protein C4556_01545 [Candidatus Parcubacteria bacterium]
MFRSLHPYSKATLIVSASAPLLLFLLPARPLPPSYVCVTELEPYTAYLIETHEWDADVCYNNGPRGEWSKRPMTNKERHILRTKRIPFLN